MIYKGTVAEQPDAFELDGHHLIERGKVFSGEDVMSRNARLGKRVLLLDDTGHWRGCGTAWHLAEQGHQVILVTPQPRAGAELVRTSADWALRQRLAKLGVETITDAAVNLNWARDLFDGRWPGAEPFFRAPFFTYLLGGIPLVRVSGPTALSDDGASVWQHIIIRYKPTTIEGGDLKLCNVTKPVRALFELIRMHRIFDIVNTREEAVQAFRN